MKATNLDRYGLDLGGRRITYDRLCRHYVCNACGGKPCHSFVGGDRVFCADCGGDDFVSETAYLGQIADGFEVLDGLPAHLRELVAPRQEDTRCLSAIEAIAALYD